MTKKKYPKPDQVYIDCIAFLLEVITNEQGYHGGGVDGSIEGYFGLQKRALDIFKAAVLRGDLPGVMADRFLEWRNDKPA